MILRSHARADYARIFARAWHIDSAQSENKLNQYRVADIFRFAGAAQFITHNIRAPRAGIGIAGDSRTRTRIAYTRKLHA